MSKSDNKIQQSVETTDSTKPTVQKESTLGADIEEARFEKFEWENKMNVAKQKISNLSIDLKHMQSIQQLKNGCVVRVMNESEYFLKKYKISSVRIWSSMNNDEMYIVNFDANEMIYYHYNGKSKLPLHWDSKWVGYKMQLW